MYQSVIYSLLSLVAISLVSSLLGLISIPVLSLLLSLGTILLVSVIVNSALSYMFGKPWRHESAIITGLILFFLLPPTATVFGLVGIALVAAFAQLSKYVLAYRGRHIFNPAAIAVVVSAGLGFVPAVWWVATPILTLPVIALGTFLLYRTNRLVMGYVFVGVSLVVLSIGSLARGSLDVEQFIAFMTSYPILFLGFYMLTEPLTQAPRHSQRLLIAAGIAIAAGAQLSIGTVFITPEIALVVGNLAGFVVGQRRAVRLRFVSKKLLAGNQVAYTFTPQNKLHFMPGQYLELTMPHSNPDLRGQRRMFTIASSPDDSQLRLITRQVAPLSTLKTAMDQLQKGTVIQATGIYGDFVLPKNKSEKLLYIAGGIGITPFLSHLQSMRLSGETRDIELLYFVSNIQDAVAIDELEKSKSFGVTFAVINERPSLNNIKQYVKDIPSRVCYVSGPPAMIDTTKSALKQLNAQRIITDQFDGY